MLNYGRREVGDISAVDLGKAHENDRIQLARTVAGLIATHGFTADPTTHDGAQMHRGFVQVQPGTLPPSLKDSGY